MHLRTMDGNFDVTVTGFESPEIDILLPPPKQTPDLDDVSEIAVGGALVGTISIAPQFAERGLHDARLRR